MIQAKPSISPVGQWLVDILETPAGAKCLEAHLWVDARVGGRRTPRHTIYGGDNLQVSIFEGKLKYLQNDISMDVL
jgi:hypothetical protein